MIHRWSGPTLPFYSPSSRQTFSLGSHAGDAGCRSRACVSSPGLLIAPTWLVLAVEAALLVPAGFSRVSRCVSHPHCCFSLRSRLVWHLIFCFCSCFESHSTACQGGTGVCVDEHGKTVCMAHGKDIGVQHSVEVHGQTWTWQKRSCQRCRAYADPRAWIGTNRASVSSM